MARLAQSAERVSFNLVVVGVLAFARYWSIFHFFGTLPPYIGLYPLVTSILPAANSLH